MAGTVRKPGTDIETLLTEAPYAWNFFRAVRYLDQLKRNASKRRRIGYSQHPKEDPVRFCQKPTLAFPASEICDYRPGDDRSPARLSQLFFGMLGVNGPMPLHITEYIYSRVKHHGDTALRDFLDMLHHRMLSFFYRCWADAQQTVCCENEDDSFKRFIGSLIGSFDGTANGREADCGHETDDIELNALLHYSGRLIPFTRNAGGLCAILSDYFGVTVDIEQFVGQWVDIPHDSRLRLMASRHTGTLGVNTVLGTRVWDCQQKFRLILGPMPFALYKNLMPGTGGFRRLLAWMNRYVGLSLDWDIQMILKKEDVPRLSLGGGIQLGYTSWMRSSVYTYDADDFIVCSKNVMRH